MQLKWQGLDPDNQRERKIEWRDLVQGINVMKTQHEIERPKLNWCKANQPKTRQKYTRQTYIYAYDKDKP